MATSEITHSSPLAVVAPALRVTFAWTLAGNVVYAGCQWGMISILAKLGSAAGVGQFALGLATTGSYLHVHEPRLAVGTGDGCPM